MLKGALGALAGIMISGCALSPYAMEGVNDLPEDQTATLTIDTPFLDPYIFITMIDGVHPRSFSNTYKLLPGMRQITMSGNAQGGFYPDHKTFVFVAEPGGHYEVALPGKAHAPYWTAGITDLSTGERIDIAGYRNPCEYNFWTGSNCEVFQLEKAPEL